MPSTKGKVLRLLSGLLLNRARVAAVSDLHGFRRVDLAGDVPSFSAGAKIQVLLPSDDARTYSPIRSAGGLSLLGWKHAGGPGAQWISTVAVGEEVHFVGPQRSIQLPAGPVLLVGDETSVAVAAAFEAERPGAVHAVIQAQDAAGVRSAAENVGLRALDVVRVGDTASTVARIAANRATRMSASIALTGSSALVVAVREAMRGAGIHDVKTKPYWIAGRKGLD